uniref:PH domain-containing protein n=1 Tax=Bombyx mori TaxID=7091 RepID=A0A8R2R313_BOMMO|nr:pleckstrin homology-like domain family B member 1 isoform X1 [Bombyx mori]
MPASLIFNRDPNRVATNTPHLVSLGTGRLSTAVTLHPIKQGRVTIGSDPTCDIYVMGTGVASVHCRVENSHGVVTLYPISGSTLLDGLPVEKPTRLSQGSMLTIGRSNYLRFNHPAEAKLMKSVLPSGHISMPPIQYQPNEECITTGYCTTEQRYQNVYKDVSLTQLDQELDLTLKELSKRKPPAVPKKLFKDQDDSNSDQERSKPSNIKSKVSKFEYYAKQQKVGRSQFYTSNENEISPKVFSANSLTVNTPAKDVLGDKMLPNYMKKDEATDKTYTNVAIRNKMKLHETVKGFEDGYQQSDGYGKINGEMEFNERFGSVGKVVCLSSPAFDRNPQYSPVYTNNHYDRSFEAENRRIKAYQERVKEEEQKEAETARLEEILNMCAEYERQISSGVPITPTEKRPHNKIITNGSLPRSVTLNNPNFVQTNDGYYKFETSQSRNASSNKPQQIQRNLSSYENYDPASPAPQPEQLTPEVTIPRNYGNIGRMDEIGIPVDDESVSSPITIRRNQNGGKPPAASPVGSPYENMYLRNNMYNLNPKSPTTQSPRTKIKTSFAHKNLNSPQYFVFPAPPPADSPNKPELDRQSPINNANNVVNHETATVDNDFERLTSAVGIEKQLSLEEEIPMIDDAAQPNDIEFRYSRTIETNETKLEDLEQTGEEKTTLVKNKSFDDVKKELMADIPELEEFEKDLKRNKRDDIIIKNISEDFKKIDADADSIDGTGLDDNADELKAKYERLKEERKKLVTEIQDLKMKMAEIRSQEDDVLRELEMEKALIKGEYDSEIAILNIEQKKRTELVEKATRIEEDIRLLKEKQEARQTELRDRVEIATMKIENIEKDLKHNAATVEELQNAQDILDNETKIFEDLEFQHLEEESELLSNKEDIQNEINVLTKKIDAQKTRILTLKSEANSNMTSALDETKVLHSEYVKLLTQVEELTARLQVVEGEMRTLRGAGGRRSPHSAPLTDAARSSPRNSDSESPSKSSTSSKEKKGFWERNFDSLKRKKKIRPPDVRADVMTQSLNENLLHNIQNSDSDFDRFNSLRHSKTKKEPGPVKSSSSSKIPTFAALGKIMKRDSFGRRRGTDEVEAKNRYVKNAKPVTNDNKYVKAKSLSPDKAHPPGGVGGLHRRSCGDEPGVVDGGRVPSQDDIDRISRVTTDAPILPTDADMNTLGKRTLDSLMEVERKRLEMLEEQGCQVIENEREKISELKRRAQDETKKLWDQKYRERSFEGDLGEGGSPGEGGGRAPEDSSVMDDSFIGNCSVFDESSGLFSSSIEELQVRNSRTESTEEDKRSDDSRPLSHASDFSRDNILSLSNAPRRSRRGIAPYSESQRPLTRYLPVDREDFDLRRHVESAGHQVELCPYVSVTSSSCRGYLHKLGAKFHTWSKRWFVFDRETKTFVYYWDKSEKKPRGGAYFQVIEEVYLDHGNTSKSPNPQTTFIVKTRQRRYYLMAPSGEAARIWIDVLFTGAQGYTEYLE